jgi:hypothetical protein
MTIKVQCDCGARYSFEVEPQNGQMPFAVNCPTCNADGTAAANQLIAQNLAAGQPAPSRLRIQETAPATESPKPLPREAPPSKSIRRIEAEARESRRAVGIFISVLVLFFGFLGAWGWFGFFGSKPKQVSSLKLTGPASGWHLEVLDAGNILLASPNRVVLRNLRAEKNTWSASLSDKPVGGMEDEEQPPQVFVVKQNIWVCTGDRVVRLDEKSGAVQQTISLNGPLASFTPGQTNILVVSAPDETHRIAMRIDLANDEVSSQDIVVPRSEKHEMPDELPPNVQPTAGVLLAQATEEHKFNKPLDAMSSEFFSAGQNIVEMRVKLLEPKVTWVQTIKPRGPSLINGQTTASTSTAAVEEEVFNDLKRDRTGGVQGIDESRYEVKLRRWTGGAAGGNQDEASNARPKPSKNIGITGAPVEWQGEVSGVPSFFSLATVDLLVAGKVLTVFDKQNNKLFEAPLSYRVNERFVTDNPGHLVPALETGSNLYFFDQGVLTAFSLPDGRVQWRITSVGITQVQADAQGLLYLDTSAAAPEEIQYSDQIRLEQAAAVIMKVDPRQGKILWQTQNRGRHTYLSGKYLYTTSRQRGGVALANGLSEALNAPAHAGPVYFHIWRLDPQSGAKLWDLAPPQAPDEVVFQGNWFVLRFDDDVQTWKFLVL